MFLQCAKHRSQNAKKVWVWHACTQVLLVVTVILSSFATQMPRDAVASTAHTRCHVVSETSWCRTPPLLAGLVFPICLSEQISCIEDSFWNRKMGGFDSFFQHLAGRFPSVGASEKYILLSLGWGSVYCYKVICLILLGGDKKIYTTTVHRQLQVD